jgi:hypothetical protein
MLVCRDVLAGSGEELSAADKIDEWASSNASVRPVPGLSSTTSHHYPQSVSARWL